MLTPSQLADIRKTNLPLYNLLRELLDSVNKMGLSAGIDPKPAPQTEVTNAIPEPKQPGGIAVSVTADTVFVLLKPGTDNAPGAQYFIERSTTAEFKEIVTYYLGTALQMAVPLIPGTYYWRAYARYPHSGKSPYTVWDGLATTTTQVSSSLFQSTQTMAVTSTTETTLLGQGVGSKDILGNTLTDGRTIRIKAAGLLRIQPGSPQLQINAKLGPTVVLSTGMVTL